MRMRADLARRSPAPFWLDHRDSPLLPFVSARSGHTGGTSHTFCASRASLAFSATTTTGRFDNRASCFSLDSTSASYQEPFLYAPGPDTSPEPGSRSNLSDRASGWRTGSENGGVCASGCAACMGCAACWVTSSIHVVRTMARVCAWERSRTRHTRFSRPWSTVAGGHRRVQPRQQLVPVTGVVLVRLSGQRHHHAGPTSGEHRPQALPQDDVRTRLVLTSGLVEDLRPRPEHLDGVHQDSAVQVRPSKWARPRACFISRSGPVGPPPPCPVAVPYGARRGFAGFPRLEPRGLTAVNGLHPLLQRRAGPARPR